MCKKSVLKVGDRVYSILIGWGDVISVSKNLIEVKLDMEKHTCYANLRSLSFTDYSGAISHDRNDIVPVFEKGELVWYYDSRIGWIAGTYLETLSINVVVGPPREKTIIHRVSSQIGQSLRTDRILKEKDRPF